MELRLRLPGSTSNLGPGFDALGMALTLYNRVTVRTTPGTRVRVVVTGAGAGSLPEDETNLFFRAARFAAERAGKPLPGLDVEMHNEVPLVRGLGSSSTAIVGGLMAANQILREPFSQPRLLDLATEIEGHPDNVSACLLGGLTICAASDGHVDFIRALPPPELRAVVAIPDFEVKTEAARAALPKTIPHRDAVFNVGRACLVLAALTTGNLQALRAGIQDRLHEPYRAGLVPGLQNVLDAALNAGALGAFLSGAGPTLLAFATENTEKIRRAMAAAWETEGIRSETAVLTIDPNGATAE